MEISFRASVSSKAVIGWGSIEASMSKESATQLLPQYLRELRRDAGLSQLDLAIRMGVHPRTVQSVEGERSWPTRYTVRTWERVCALRARKHAA